MLGGFVSAAEHVATAAAGTFLLGTMRNGAAAESVDLAQGLPPGVMRGRFLDILVGCMVALAGAVCLHSPDFRRWIARPLHWMLDRQGRP